MIRVVFFFLLSLLVFATLYIVTVILIVFALSCYYLGFQKGLEIFIKVWSRSVFIILLHRFRIFGRENIDPSRNYILVCNHASAFDIPAVMSFYPGVSWFGREHLLQIPLFGQVLKASHFIPMKESGVKNARVMLEKLIRNSNGHTIAIFPEGTRTLDGKMNRFHKGFVHVVRSSGLDLLPVTLNGFYHLKPKNRFYIAFNSKVSANIHTPILNESLINMRDDEIVRTVRGILNSEYKF